MKTLAPHNNEVILLKTFVCRCLLWYLYSRETRSFKHSVLDVSHLTADVLQSFSSLSWHFTALKLLSSVPLPLPTLAPRSSLTWSPPSAALLWPTPSLMSLIHQPDSINRIPIAVCLPAARRCLCLYESITPALAPTPCLWHIYEHLCVCVCACVRVHVWILNRSSAFWPNL